MAKWASFSGTGSLDLKCASTCTIGDPTAHEEPGAVETEVDRACPRSVRPTDRAAGPDGGLVHGVSLVEPPSQRLGGLFARRAARRPRARDRVWSGDRDP